LQTDQPTRASDSKRLTVLSPAERTALYGLPDFDDFQRGDFFAMTEAERALADRRKGPVERLHCLLQIGYFKAKQAFFNFDAQDIATEDIEFLVGRYFPRETVALRPLRQDERYTQRTEIAKLFGYRLWSATDRPGLIEMAALLARRDVKPTFILVEVLGLLKVRKIVRPGYTTLQTIISDVLVAERGRLASLIEEGLDASTCAALQDLLVREGTLSELAALKQDAKHFGYQMMLAERQKYATLAPLHTAGKVILPRLGISQQNTRYYASLVHYYTIFDLRRMTAGQRHLYLLCYAWERYRQINDNLADAFSHGMAQIEQETKEASEEAYAKAVEKRQREAPRVGRVLLLYVDETVDDTTPFGEVRKRAFTIMPKDDLLTAGNRLCERSDSQIELRWRAVDRAAGRFKRTLRPLVMTIDFSAEPAGRPWRAGLSWMKDVFNCQQRLAQRPLAEVPADTMPERLRPYLFDFDEAGKPTRLRGDRYEFWVYRQLRKRLVSGELYLDDSVRHRRFSDELVDPVRTPEVLKNLSIPWLRQPADVTVGALCDELDRLWRTFDHDLRAGKLKHLEFDPEHNTLSWRKPRIDRDEALQSSFYAKLQARAVPDVFRFVNARCGFLSALTPLQPRYAKKIADEDSLMAVIVAQAMNHGMLGMAETSDISYDVLEETHQQHLRLATLREANDKISNFIAGLDIFPLYSFGTETLYGGVDGQKFEAATPTIKARYSRKYFGRGKGVVAYTLLANHVPLETELIGANEHESHYVFDICYNNTSDIVPTAITGDMHIINKANFAVTYWFGLKLSPRFTNLQAQVQHLYCGTNPPEENPYLLQPAGQIDRQAIVADDNTDIDRIIATLGLKEASQSALIRKLCALSQHNPTRKAIFEFDKLVRSIYTLNYFRDAQLQRDVHRSQNRLEAYHQLRSAIAQVGGRKQLAGRTDLDMAISNQCARLIANVIIAYNSVVLSKLLERYQATGNQKAIQRLQKISPVAWRHIHLLGRYMFRDRGQPIDLDALLADVSLT
jgi:TnpA family transposase